MSLCVYIVISERLAGGTLGVKHGVAAFVIRFLECYYNNAATCCCRAHSHLVDGVLVEVVRYGTELRIGS